MEILGIPLAVSDYEEVLDWMDAMIAAGERGYVTAAAVNLVMSAREQPATREAALAATLAVPDGMPLVWALRLLGHPRATRIYGPDLMAAFCARAARNGTPVYLYGGRTPEALELLTGRLRERFPGLAIVGGCSPPFRELTPEEERRVVVEIDDSGAEVVWVGTGQPKQERWMHAHAPPPARAAARRGRRRLRLPRRPRPPGAPVDAARTAWSGPTDSRASRAGCGVATPATTPASLRASPASTGTSVADAGSAPGCFIHSFSS